jgi:O-antigen/teichoic acid export membrane protein
VLKKSLLNISFVSAGNVINAGLGFLFIAAAAKSLTVEDFGRYALITSLLVSLAKITDFGTNSLFVAKSITQNSPVTNRFVSLRLLLFIATIPISYAVLTLLNFNQPEILMLFFFGLVVYTINFFLFGFFQKLEQFHWVLALNFIPAFIKGVIAVFIFIGIYNPTYTQLFFIFGASVLPSALLYFFLPSDLKNYKLSFADTKNLFTEVFPAGFSQLINEGWPAIANSIAKITRSFADVGIFSLAEKISGVFALISLSIFTVLLPKNALRKKEKNRYDFRETFVISAGILVLSIIAMVFAKYFIPFFFGERYSDSILLVDFLILAAGITAIHTFMENYFFVEGRTKVLMYISTIRLTAFLVGSALLIPTYSLIGLAYAQLAAAIVALGVTLYVILPRPTLFGNPPSEAAGYPPPAH